MLENLLTYLQFGNQFCGIEHTTKNGNNTIVVSELKKTKTEVDVERFFEIDSIEKVGDKLPKKQHAFLIINNSNVLTKKVESEQVDNSRLVNKAFPNINVSDFYFEILHQNNNHFVSICRKKYVDELIDQYKTRGIRIINLSIGNGIVSNVINYINSDEIHTSNSLISKEKDTITNIIKQKEQITETYDLNGLNVSNNELLSFSGALASIQNNYRPITNFDAQKQVLLNDFKQSQFFSQFLKFGLIFILGLLLINFIFFNHYFNKVNKLEQTSQVNLSTKQKVLELNESVKKTQKMVDDMLNSDSSKSSFYVNEIIQSLSNSIVLSELNYQPLIKRIKTEQPIEVNKNSIIISGQSSNSEHFSEWISNLESKKWINKVEIIDYENSTMSLSNFTINLTTNNE